VSGTLPHADTEGPRPGPRCWVVARGVSGRSAWGRAKPEKRFTRRAKKTFTAVKNRKLGFAGDHQEIAGAGEPGV
jgi:hypothetical protein